MVYLTGDTHGSYRHAHTRPASFVPQALHAGVKARWTLRWKTGSKSSRNALDYRRWFCGRFHIEKQVADLRFVYYDILEF